VKVKTALGIFTGAKVQELQNDTGILKTWQHIFKKISMITGKVYQHYLLP
jgi:hypothetical protein